MLAVRLDEETENRLDYLAKITHRTKTFYVKQALLEYLDDLEDIYIAEQRLEDIALGYSKTVSMDDVKKQLGIS
jgi:RHH-type transcriptional regulator, rel operon repressor / antitoxin RelB